MDVFNREDVDALSIPNFIKNKILGDIFSGKLNVGDRILEQHYSQELKVSRAPVREAIAQLAAEGFIEKIPRKGTVVKTYSVEEMKDLINLRFYLEIEAVNKLKYISNLDEYIKTLSELSELIAREKATRPGSEYNYRFHYQLISASGSKVLESAYPKHYLYALQANGYKRDSMSLDKATKEHATIIQCLKEKDFEKAKLILMEHKQDLLSLIKDYALGYDL